VRSTRPSSRRGRERERRGLYNRLIAMLLSEAIEELCIATRADGRSPRTIEAYREKLKYLLVFLGDVEFESITLADLRRYVSYLWDCDLSEFTVKSRVRHFKRLFNFAEEEGIITSNPSRRIKTPNPKREKPKGILWEDFIALLESTKEGTWLDVRDRAVILLLFDTGCRVGGLAGLKVSDVDLEQRRAVVREKGGKSRFVFFRPETAQELVTWLEMRPDDKGPWLFVSANTQADKLSERGVYRMLRRRGEQAGCTGPVNPHAFRHGFARHFLMSGGDLGTLSDIMGHCDVSVTKSFYGIFTTVELQQKHELHSPIAKLGGGANEEKWYNDSKS
jgi:site-specific recombinase XerD